MADFIKNILRMSMVALVVPGLAFGVQQQNPRGANNARATSARSADATSNASIRRSATSVIARSAGQNARQNRAVVTARPMTARSASVRSVRPMVSGGALTRSAVRSANVRSAVVNKKSIGKPGVSRAATARATAVFNDISKIGGGYSNCRDAYATCMDQMCANANDTYRRCFCSDRFTGFRETSDKLDEALKMLADFQDNNLNAVDKSASEVNAMYTATAGEDAIKRDTSASQKLLDSISDVLSGKKASTPKNSTSSLGLLDVSGFGSFDDDIFGDTTSSLFGKGDSYKDVSSLEGKELYDNAMQQCVEITREACGSDAMFNLARSAYSIMITQDCNAYEKNINAKKASVEETVRTAEKYLREARLEEYRAHNSADVNECLAKVEEAIRKPTACGSKYEKCLDYTGKYINATTGEPVYSQALFGLNNLIVLKDTADVLGGENAAFNKWLDEKKIYATTALDSCRDIADNVWYEFKRSAIIQIAQAQDEKIQQVKDSCVETMKECYDKQTGALKSIDTTELQGTAAIAAATARGMCYDRVQACAALYGEPDGCKYNDKTKKLEANGTKTCGLQSLLVFVDTVDSVKVAEGCESVLRKYVAEICPEDEENEIKYGGMCLGSKDKLRVALENRVKIFCAQDLVTSDTSSSIREETTSAAYNLNIMNQLLKEIYDELKIGFSLGCEQAEGLSTNANGEEVYEYTGGTWVSVDQALKPSAKMLYQDFYKKYYGVTVESEKQMQELGVNDHGWCVKSSEQKAVEDGEVQVMCEMAEGKWNTEKKQCSFEPNWYPRTCVDLLGGTWISSKKECLLDDITPETLGMEPEESSADRGGNAGGSTNAGTTMPTLFNTSGNISSKYQDKFEGIQQKYERSKGNNVIKL